MKALTMISTLLASLTMGQNNESSEEELRKLIANWDAALVARDIRVLSKILSEDYVFIGPDGHTASKTAYLRSIESSPGRSSSTSTVTRFVFRKDLSIVSANGSSSIGTKKFNYVFTDVWIREGDTWKAIWTHSTLLKETASR